MLINTNAYHQMGSVIFNLRAISQEGPMKLIHTTRMEITPLSHCGLVTPYGMPINL